MAAVRRETHRTYCEEQGGVEGGDPDDLDRDSDGNAHSAVLAYEELQGKTSAKTWVADYPVDETLDEETSRQGSCC